MLSVRIRTTMIALVASLSVAVATFSPAVSQAAKNNGGYSKSNEAAKAKMREDLCENLGKDFEKQVDKAGKAYESKGAASTEFDDAMTEAGIDLELAKGEKCGWALSARGPSNRLHIPGVHLPVGAS